MPIEFSRLLTQKSVVAESMHLKSHNTGAKVRHLHVATIDSPLSALSRNFENASSLEWNPGLNRHLGINKIQCQKAW